MPLGSRGASTRTPPRCPIVALRLVRSFRLAVARPPLKGSGAASAWADHLHRRDTHLRPPRPALPTPPGPVGEPSECADLQCRTVILFFTLPQCRHADAAKQTLRMRDEDLRLLRPLRQVQPRLPLRTADRVPWARPAAAPMSAVRRTSSRPPTLPVRETAGPIAAIVLLGRLLEGSPPRAGRCDAEGRVAGADGHGARR